LRATRLDPLCTDAWIAFGCSFAACDESDQALASFRAAQRLAPAESSALLYMGMEYVRTNHLVLAQHALRAALPGRDPLCWHEMGVVHFAKKDYDEAISWFRKALLAIVQLEKSGHENESPIELIQNPYWEPTLFNLGHAYRKTMQFDLALKCYEQCLVLVPDNASARGAVGFTMHLQSNLEEAIDSYHQALAMKGEDAFCLEMLSRALEESLSAKPVHMNGTTKFNPQSQRGRINPFGLGSDDDDDDVDMNFG
jgi:anaphase-promoting complex subunit 6